MQDFLYDEFATPHDPLENVKLAFFDITLTDAGGDNAQMAVLRDALKSYISVKIKLLFWCFGRIDQNIKMTLLSS